MLCMIAYLELYHVPMHDHTEETCACMYTIPISYGACLKRMLDSCDEFLGVGTSLLNMQLVYFVRGSVHFLVT